MSREGGRVLCGWVKAEWAFPLWNLWFRIAPWRVTLAARLPSTQRRGSRPCWDSEAQFRPGGAVRAGILLLNWFENFSLGGNAFPLDPHPQVLYPAEPERCPGARWAPGSALAHPGMVEGPGRGFVNEPRSPLQLTDQRAARPGRRGPTSRCNKRLATRRGSPRAARGGTREGRPPR